MNPPMLEHEPGGFAGYLESQMNHHPLHQTDPGKRTTWKISQARCEIPGVGFSVPTHSGR